MNVYIAVPLFWTSVLRTIVVGGLAISFATLSGRHANATEPLTAAALLEAHCVQCHGGNATKGGLNLLTRESLLRGGESGATVVPGDPEASLLIQTIRHDIEPQMPYKAPKLSDMAIAVLAGWVKAGVPYDRPLIESVSKEPHAQFTVSDNDRNHWSFQPVRAVPIPDMEGHASICATPIDQFILARLSSKDLSFAARAEKDVMIRRVTFDLIGLPPTPAEIIEFEDDLSADAYERLIDRLLASPHYGERWGRHWLDLARYAETDGFELDAVRPHSWRYRDYVINAFNSDKPYDRFVREQVAGDQLWADDNDAVTATSFNLLGPDMVDSADQIQRRLNALNDMTDTTAATFLGLTIGCARCHDHKFEPLSQQDYYRLQAYFTPAAFHRDKSIPTVESQRLFETTTHAFNEHPTVRELADLERPVRERLVEKKKSKLSAEAQRAHQTPTEQRTVQQQNLVLETEDDLKVSLKEVMAALDAEEKQRHAKLQDELKKVPRPIPLPKTMALGTNQKPAKTFVLRRGEYSQPEEEVSPGFPVVLQPAGSREDGNRAQLADWIASRQNPLTARVMVNRIWQHHFGRGLVTSASDFGTHGQAPSHPALLDWLANQFMEGDWSIKRMHRLIMISTTYRTVSASSKDFAADPENQLYGRMNRLRLEGEVIRDALLAVSGQLNPALGGPSVFPPIPKELSIGPKTWVTSERASDHVRRSVYIFARRNLRFPFLEVFDYPDSNLSCPVREGSTTAPQSLTLLNAVEVMTAATKLESRLKTEASSTNDQINLAYRLVLGRTPAKREFLLAQEFLSQFPLQEFCRALFNLNEFVYVE